MKIPLNVNSNGSESAREAQNKALARDFLAARKGDWQAKHNLIRTLSPLIHSMAEKRAHGDQKKLNEYVEAGKQGVTAAAKKFKASIDKDHVQLFAVDFIEKAMNGIERPGGLLTRLFKRS